MLLHLLCKQWSLQCRTCSGSTWIKKKTIWLEDQYEHYQSMSKSARIRNKFKVFFFGLDFFLRKTNIGVSDVLCFNHSWHWLFGRIQWLLKAHPESLGDRSYMTVGWVKMLCFRCGFRDAYTAGGRGWVGGLICSCSLSCIFWTLPWARHQGRLWGFKGKQESLPCRIICSTGAKCSGEKPCLLHFGLGGAPLTCVPSSSTITTLINPGAKTTVKEMEEEAGNFPIFKNPHEL